MLAMVWTRQLFVLCTYVAATVVMAISTVDDQLAGTDAIATNRRQSSARVSFFPQSDEEPQYTGDGKYQADDQFRFTTDQRNEFYNQNEIQQRPFRVQPMQQQQPQQSHFASGQSFVQPIRARPTASLPRPVHRIPPWPQAPHAGGVASNYIPHQFAGSTRPGYAPLAGQYSGYIPRPQHAYAQYAPPQQQLQQQQQQQHLYPQQAYAPYQQQQQQQQQYQQTYAPQQPYSPFPAQYAGYNDYDAGGGNGGTDNFLGSLFNSLRPGGSNLFNPENAFGGGGGGGGLTANAGNQFSKAIEDITRYDDLQCVPKLICRMVGNPRGGQSSLPTFVNAPTLTALISALPSTSPFLVFGRAALLGLSGGETGCQGAFPRCPRSEDDILYYLNNHRGGFFRFFNGGASFGDDVDEDEYNQLSQQYQQNLQQQQQQQQQQQPQQQNEFSTPSTTSSGISQLSALQTIAEAINQNGGINLSNLGANFGGGSSSSGSSGSGAGGGASNLLSSLVAALSGGGGGGGGILGFGNAATKSDPLRETAGNLLTGLIGNRFNSRKIRKRDVASSITAIDDLIADGSAHYDKPNPIRKRNLSNSDEPPLTIGSSHQSLNTAATVAATAVAVATLKNVTDLRNTLAKILNESESRIMNNQIVSEHFDTTAAAVHHRVPVVFPFNPDAYDALHYVPVRGIKSINFDKSIVFPSIQLYNKQEAVNPVAALRFPLSANNVNKGGNSHNNNNNNNNNNNGGGGDGSFDYDDDSAEPNVIGFNVNELDGTQRPMIFPDRTGTGNLRFDNDHFDLSSVGRILTSGGTNNNANTYTNNNNNNNDNNNNRFEPAAMQEALKTILAYLESFPQQTKIGSPSQHRYEQYTTTHLPVRGGNANYNDDDRFDRFKYHKNNNHRRPETASTYYATYSTPSQSAATHKENVRKGGDAGNIYVTNARGVIEYYINRSGHKVYV